jgi:hypothetical protein
VGDNTLLTYDGTSTWDTVTFDASKRRWNAINYLNGKYIAVGATPFYGVMNSDNGSSWTVQNTPFDYSWSKLVYGGSDFVAMGIDTENKFASMRSADGQTWSSSTIVPISSGDYINTLSTNGSQYLAMGRNNSNYLKIWTSADGQNWTTTTTTLACSSISRAIYGNGKYVATGYVSANNYKILTSSDGTTWTANNTADNTKNWGGLAYGQIDNNDVYVSVASNGTGNRAMYSADGQSWIAAPTTDDTKSWYGVAYGAGKFVAVSSNATNKVMYSTNGSTWIATPSANDSYGWHKVYYANGYFMATAGDLSYFMYSADGITWTLGQPFSNSFSPNTLAFGAGKWVGIASSGNGNRVQINTQVNCSQ